MLSLNVAGPAKNMKLASAAIPFALAWLLATSACQLSGEEKTVAVSESELRTAAIQKIEPDYPAVARQIRLTGTVELEILVNASGAVEKVSVVKGNTLLTGPSLQAIRRWKFKPFGTGAEPAKASGPIRFNFQM
jgi:periplasmic protein TonB